MAPPPSEFQASVTALCGLPPSAKSPASIHAWQKALNNRDFQDKILRVFQYGMRAICYKMLQADAKHDVANRMVATYKQISISRKGFRLMTTLAHFTTAYDNLKDCLEETDIVKALLVFRWVFFGYFIVWDHMYFLTFPSKPLITRWSSAVTRQRLVYWRAVADLFGFAAELIKHFRARKAVAKVQALPSAGSEDKLATAEFKLRESWYPLIKMGCDVGTYFPQSELGTFVGWHSGWYHDGHVGIAGVIAALCSSRSQWLSLK